jgi:hypothetical protein
MTRIKKAQDGKMQLGGIQKAKAREKRLQEEVRRRNASPLQIEKGTIAGLPASEKEKVYRDMHRRSLEQGAVRDYMKKNPIEKYLPASNIRRKKSKMGGKVTKAEGGKWIQKAIKKPGALRKQLGAKPGQPIPAGKLAAAAKKPGKLGQRARLAQTLKKMHKK